MGPRQKLQREERRAPARGTVVVETAAEHLGLLGEAKLADGAKGDRALAEVPAVNCLVDLFVDVSAEVCERALVGNGRGALDSRCENRRQLDGWPVIGTSAGTVQTKPGRAIARRQG
jgi:hypothetical protein